MKLNKYPENPILSPNPLNSWENLVVCNPAAWYEDGKFYLLYRAAGDDVDHLIHIGLAVGEDGFHFSRVLDKPVLSPGENSFDAGSVEDPRVVKFGDEFYMTYAFRPYPPGQYWKYSYDEVKAPKHNEFAPKCLLENIGNTALAVSKDLIHFKKVGRLTEPGLDDRDVIFFPERINGRFYMIHRPKNYVGKEYGTDHPAIWIKSSDDLMSWNVPSRLLLKGEQWWEQKVGGNTPPLRTDAGWLMLYHGVDEKFTYRIGACLLDLEDPTKILYRTKDFIMEPETAEEMNGLYKWGVVFPTGNVIVGDTLYVYYGASDQWCCVATANVKELVTFIRQNSVGKISQQQNISVPVKELVC
jgi:beta-1,2-mannobiose phosphorylase / 1,2-beta-oligomannan phosphorylase